MLTVYTIGHSTRTANEFVDLLQTYGVTQLADIRTVPRSRHNPQFGVRDIMSPTRAPDHQLTNFAHVEGTTITYPADPSAS